MGEMSWPSEEKANATFYILSIRSKRWDLPKWHYKARRTSWLNPLLNKEAGLEAPWMAKRVLRTSVWNRQPPMKIYLCEINQFWDGNIVWPRIIHGFDHNTIIYISYLPCSMKSHNSETLMAHRPCVAQFHFQFYNALSRNLLWIKFCHCLRTTIEARASCPLPARNLYWKITQPVNHAAQAQSCTEAGVRCTGAG